ncbi:ABC transporter permease subunit [Cellulomonas xiejunii]|uniref:ABC transporter permease subunit n=1 Tax=Cellulomonas xiejunii TaxID=2968083 RepID=A0ABY5KRK5_9CELL|nr:ABC transporter permease subunit [Cellulomonas xiejunii]MCC2315521.1 ABC transporter permease subunit [Cellulomonas xiejunii]MCC2320685.1 ABC transporter permease subunit [Cellulomonas xiejunii]UUI70973.1 ABC transporter permease subunit [Cellulomonas xiejunii]
MSATTVPRAARPAAGARSGGPTFGRVVAAEWTKLTSLRSPWWTALVTVVVAGAISYMSATASSVDPGFEPTRDLSTGLMLAQLGPLVLGVLYGAGEFRTGAFRTTFALVPRRWPVLAAQAVVLTAFTLVLGVVTVAVCVAGVMPAAASRDMPLRLAEGETPGAMLGMVVLLLGMALLGLAFGALLRRTVPALVTALVVLVFLPVTLQMMSDPGVDANGMALPHSVTPAGAVSVFTPGTGIALLTTSASSEGMPGTPDVGPVGGGLVVGAWIVLLLVVAGVRLRARDAR